MENNNVMGKKGEKEGEKGELGRKGIGQEDPSLGRHGTNELIQA